MAIKKSLPFLPTIFQTDVNQKFLSATLDQLISEPNLTDINGYVGRKFAPTYKMGDSYIIESTDARQNYQLEPSIVVSGKNSEITFFASYIDVLNKIQYYGGLTNNHNRLFNNEYYSYDPAISLDAMVNFTQYYWLPNGPDAVNVNANGVPLQQDFVVSRDISTRQYKFSSGKTSHNSVKLAYGGTYTFTVDQPGVPFWIQAELGIDGLMNVTPSYSSRVVVGVENNGIDVGTITFKVPQYTAQDRFILMQSMYNVDFAVSISYASMQNQLLSRFLVSHPEYVGLSGQFDGKTIIFVDQHLLTNGGEEAWTEPGLYGDPDDPNYDAGPVVPVQDRLSVFKIFLTQAGDTDFLIQLIPVQTVTNEQKVFIKQGLKYASTDFFVDVDNLYHQVPLITCNLAELYYQDGLETDIYGSFKMTQTTGYQMDVLIDIIGKKTFTSPNGVTLTNGMKILFDTSVLPIGYQNKEFYVEGVGQSIKLVDVTLLVTPELYNRENTINYPDLVFPDYITINRGSKDLNAWSRGNRWFHRDVITTTAEYNGVSPVFNQPQRAQRPIVQFNADLLLTNSGRFGKRHIDILDTTITDAFNTLDGAILTTAFGIPLVDGLRVILAVDNDPLIRNRIYIINMVQYQVDTSGIPIGPVYVNLTVADDGENEFGDTVTIMQGQYAGTQWWFNGDHWVESQQKTMLQQDPIFDMFDSAGISFTSYPGSTFTGTKLIGYNRKAGVIDKILNFSLSYRSLTTQGDIEFKNYIDSDTFTYTENQITKTVAVSTGFLQTIVDKTTTQARNVWATVAEPSAQYQLFEFIYDGINNLFTVDVLPAERNSIPSIKVYYNNKFLSTNEWTLIVNDSQPAIVLTPILTTGDKIDVLIYSDEVSSTGQYEIPLNLDLNAQNISINLFTLGQIRNHLTELSENTTELVGNILGSNNLRDINLTAQGGNILQHSAPLPYASLFLLDETANFVDALRFTQKEYARFKNKFLESCVTLVGVDPTDPVGSVDLILTNLNAIKNQTFPFYHSDMVPYGYVVNTIQYTIFDPLVTAYEITNVFSDIILSNKAILVYHNGIQLIKGIDYIFNTDRPAITLNVPLEVDDLLKFVEYSDTDGNYIPETPTKLGMYPKFVPEIYLDDTYREPIYAIRGHDGSITPAFDDYRDSFLLELEMRIYNNIKLSDSGEFNDIYTVIPGKFRPNDYSLSEANQLLSINFLTWLGNNNLDYTVNDSFNSNDAFTWNYSGIADRIDGTLLPGSWRACYLYFFDTLRPHTSPWEMLGFTSIPSWWEGYYGPGPYTGGNSLLWSDLEEGRIEDGPRKGIDLKFARPGLSKIIPVDASGFLLSPAVLLAQGFNSNKATIPWTVGQIGPAEFAWRSSSEFPFAIQMALALAKPARYFSVFADTYRINKNTGVNQWLTNSGKHINQRELEINGKMQGTEITRSSGYLNWIASYLTNQGIDPVTKIESMLTNYQVQLAYKLAGFSDQRYMQVLAEQSSPSSTNASVYVPKENYEFYLYKSTPVNKLIYSSVIVEKTTSGYSVRGYDLTNPFFTIIPSVVNNSGYKITVLNSTATIFNNYQAVKITVPYGYEFTSQQQLVDFLISYQRYLMAQGFTFTESDPTVYENRDWVLSSKEFLYWAQQGWKVGSIIVLSPIANSINAISVGAIADEITDSQYGTKVMDQNYNIVKKTNYTILRTPTSFKLTLLNDAVIGLIEINLVQYEHVILFDNKTVFNDVIYEPELGNRQYRLKLVGQKTAAWDGSLNAPGFIYNSSTVDAWVPSHDYLKGDLVDYKNQYYVALNNVVAAPEFLFSEWQQITSSSLKVGLLPNLQTLAFKSEEYYNPYATFDDISSTTYSHGLIGFRPRQYLEDLGLTETTQIEFYKGFIKQKGTLNAINQLSNAQFNNLNSAITLYEEWAIRVGEYGALVNNPYVEILLDEQTFSVNPAQASFAGEAQSVAQTNSVNGLNVFDAASLYKFEEIFDGTIALNRTDTSDYENDLPTAGYVNLNDVNATVFDLSSITSLDTQLSVIGSGYIIWTTKDFTNKWNIYRVTETDSIIIELSNALDGYLRVTTNSATNLVDDDVIMVKNFDDAFDGFYKVHSIIAPNEFIIKAGEVSASLTSLSGNGILFKLDSVRFEFMADAVNFTPPHGWKANDKIWVDVGTTTPTGEPQWNVFNKTEAWKSDASLSLQLSADEYEADDNFGTSVKLANQGALAIVGLSNATAYKNNSILGTYIIPLGGWAWGGDATGQLGISSTISKSSPVQIGSRLDWVQLVAANNFSVGITSSYTLYAWGNNTNGQLGQSSLIAKSSPVQVGSLTNWLYVSAAESHVAAIKIDGTLWAWGFNNYGQLGLGDAIDRSSPVQVGSLTDWSQVSCGDGITAAVKQDGTLWAWGDNVYGQLGLGDEITRLSPVQVGSLTNWAYVSCGL